MNSELYALHSTDVTQELRPVRRLLVNCCWFLVPVDETFAVVLTNGNTVADRCSFYCTTVAFAGAFSTS